MPRLVLWDPPTRHFEVGNSKEVRDEILALRPGELSLPVHTDRGYVVLSLKQVLPAHPGTLEEVHDKLVSDLKDQKANELAKSKADDLEKRVTAGEKFAAAAKSLGLDPKTSDELNRAGSIAGVGSGKQLAPAFALNVGQVGAPLQLIQNWLVYQVAAKTEANPADFEKQKRTITDNLLQEKRGLAFETFRTSLEARLKAEGKLKMYPDRMRGFGSGNIPIS